MNQPTVDATNLRIVKARSESGICLKLEGTLDADAAPLVADEFEARIRSGEHDIEIDLSAIEMISSAGIGSLIAGVAEARDEGGTVRVVRMSDAARHVFAMLDLIDYLCDVESDA